MSLMFIVYLVGLIPNIIGLLQGVLTVYGLGLVVLLISAPAWFDYHRKEVFAQVKKYAFLPITAALLLVVIPSEKTTWYMVGAYGTQKLVESPVAQELASDGVDVLKDLLAKAKRELGEEKPKEDKK